MTHSKRYNYVCAKCEGKVSKEQCRTAREKDGKTVREKYFGLGGWECVNCGHGSKVKRSLKNE